PHALTVSHENSIGCGRLTGPTAGLLGCARQQLSNRLACQGLEQRRHRFTRRTDLLADRKRTRNLALSHAAQMRVARQCLVSQPRLLQPRRAKLLPVVIVRRGCGFAEILLKSVDTMPSDPLRVEHRISMLNLLGHHFLLLLALKISRAASARLRAFRAALAAAAFTVRSTIGSSNSPCSMTLIPPSSHLYASICISLCAAQSPPTRPITVNCPTPHLRRRSAISRDH